MNSMVMKVKKNIEENRLIESKDHVIVGLSGGADSTFLFCALKELKEEVNFSLYALHLEHGIRGEDSLKDAQFSQKLCEENDIPFKLVSVDVPRLAEEKHLSLEEAGRFARYAAFDEYGQEICEKMAASHDSVKIAVAHHANDNAETILFNITRGSGINGGAGIKPVTVRREGYEVIRPMLGITRGEIEEYLKELGQDYCIDATNDSIDYSRNRIRKEIIPQLKLLNENAIEHFSSFSRELQDVSDYMASETTKAIDRCAKYKNNGLQTKCIDIDAEALKKYHKVIIRNVLRKALIEVTGREKDLTHVHIESLEGLLGMQSGRKLDLPYNVEAINNFGIISIYLKKNKEEQADRRKVEGSLKERLKIREFSLETKDFSNLDIPKKGYTKWIDYDKMIGELSVRYPRDYDKICIDAEGHTKSIKDYLKGEKIPAAMRKEVVLVADDREVIWVVGHRINERYKVTEQTKKIVELIYLMQSEEEQNE